MENKIELRKHKQIFSVSQRRDRLEENSDFNFLGENFIEKNIFLDSGVRERERAEEEEEN
jgi:hypothetical protein